MQGEFTLKREERLRGNISTGRLFSQGQSGFIYPFRYYFITDDAEAATASILVSIPKKLFKRAVKRNLLKRRTREAYRLNKSILLSSEYSYTKATNIAFVYAAKEALDYGIIENGIKRILTSVAKGQSTK